MTSSLEPPRARPRTLEDMGSTKLQSHIEADAALRMQELVI